MRETILIIENSLDTTGAFKAIFSYAQCVKRDYEIIFIIPNNSRIKEQLNNADFKVVSLPFIEIRKNLKSLLLYFPLLVINGFRLKKIIRQHEVKLVHTNDFYNLVGVVAKALGGKFLLITHVRFMPNRFPEFLVKIWMKLSQKYAERIICVSEAVRNSLPYHNKICVIYDSIFFNENNELLTKDFRAKDNFIRLLYLSHYIPGKGQNYALKAFAEAYRQNTRLRIKFVGGDMELEKNKAFKQGLISETNKLNLTDVVSFYGSTNEVAKEILLSDIVLNFSESESFSITCLEALLCGTPLIATDCGGPAELMQHKRSGLLVSNRDIHAMADAIVKLADDAEFRRNIGINGKLYVERKFSYQNTICKLKQLYSKVLNC